VKKWGFLADRTSFSSRAGVQSDLMKLASIPQHYTEDDLVKEETE
jgi:hypothetical protein